jgi:hypothetical protein
MKLMRNSCRASEIELSRDVENCFDLGTGFAPVRFRLNAMACSACCRDVSRSPAAQLLGEESLVIDTTVIEWRIQFIP